MYDIKISGPDDIKEVRDLVIGSFDDQIRFYKSYDATLASLKDEMTPISIEEYRQDYMKDISRSGAVFDEKVFRAEYDEYVAEALDELNSSLAELNQEYRSLKDAVLMTKPGRHGYFEFSMCQYPTEGEGETISPYEWQSKLVDGHGRVLSLAYGTLYIGGEGCNAREMPYLADIYTAQELSVVNKYLKRLSENLDCDGEDSDWFDNYALAEMQLEEGGIMLVQYLKRDMTRRELKGVGFEVLKYASECMQKHFDENVGELSVGLFYNLYMKVDTSYIKSPTPGFLNKLTSVMGDIGFVGCVELIDYWGE